MGEEGYILSDTKYAEELERLTQQANIFDPVTIRHLETIGVAEGWRCLEVGAGTGSIAEWLTRRVGPAGKVVATDIDLRFLNRLSAPNLEIRRHDILRDELEENQYDLVQCRKLLHHLPEPEKTVRKMADALRPGGWLLLEEDDQGSRLSADITNPSLTPYVVAYTRLIDDLRKSGRADYYIGRRVRGFVEDLGFVDVGQEGWTCMVRGGDPQAQLWVMGLQTVGSASATRSLLTQDEIERFRRMFMDPALYFPFYTLFCAWGRKPVYAASVSGDVESNRGEVGGDD